MNWLDQVFPQLKPLFLTTKRSVWQMAVKKILIPIMLTLSLPLQLEIVPEEQKHALVFKAKTECVLIETRSVQLPTSIFFTNLSKTWKDIRTKHSTKNIELVFLVHSMLCLLRWLRLRKTRLVIYIGTLHLLQTLLKIDSTLMMSLLGKRCIIHKLEVQWKARVIVTLKFKSWKMDAQALLEVKPCLQDSRAWWWSRRT